MKKGIGPNNLGSPAKMGHGMKTMAKMYDSPAKKNGPGKEDVRRADMYAGAAGSREGYYKLEKYKKDNPRAARKMSSDQDDRIRDSYRNAEISRRRAESPERYYNTSKLSKKK